MTEMVHQTAPTQFVEAKGIRFAYRRFGKAGGVPLAFNMHFTGTMDHWDPLVTDGLAKDREVILFDNAGISSSSGEVPTTVEGMAADAAAFIKALGLKQVDLLGFSIGGTVTQALTLAEPQLVRRLVLVGTGPRGGEGMATFTPEAQRIFGAPYAEPDLLWQHVHFDATETSQAAGAAFLKRFRLRRENRRVPWILLVPPLPTVRNRMCRDDRFVRRRKRCARAPSADDRTRVRSRSSIRDAVRPRNRRS